MIKFISRIKNKSNAFQQVVDACHFILENDSVASLAKQYLNKRLPTYLQSFYGLGYFPDNYNIKFLLSLVDKSLLEKLGLIKFDGQCLYGHYHQHNLIFPLRDSYGNIIAILGRTLLPEEEYSELGINKYKYSYGYQKNLHLFGLDIAKDDIVKKDCVICVEGQFDCMTCYANGIQNVVALGCASMSRYQFYQLNRYTNNIVLMLDGDESGRDARNKIRNKYSRQANFKSVSVPKGYKDIDEFFRKENDAVWRQSVVDGLLNLEI